MVYISLAVFFEILVKINFVFLNVNSKKSFKIVAEHVLIFSTIFPALALGLRVEEIIDH